MQLSRDTRKLKLRPKYIDHNSTGDMGHDTSTLQGKVKAIRDNKTRMTDVSFDQVDINEKFARKIADGLRENK